MQNFTEEPRELSMMKTPLTLTLAAAAIRRYDDACDAFSNIDAHLKATKLLAKRGEYSSELFAAIIDQIQVAQRLVKQGARVVNYKPSLTFVRDSGN